MSEAEQQEQEHTHSEIEEDHGNEKDTKEQSEESDNSSDNSDSSDDTKEVEKQLVQTFMEITGLDHKTAKFYLQMANGDTDLAFTLLSENPRQNSSHSNIKGITQDSDPMPVVEPFVREADPTQMHRLIDIRSTSVLAKERELARKEDHSVNWMFPPSRQSNPNQLIEVRKQANRVKKWILVNLQNHKEFASHLLNRDVWSSEPLMQHIQSNLIFWQRGSTSPDGQKFLSYYQFSENELPIVGIIDPRTGGLIWTVNGAVDASDLLSKLLEFEETNKLDSNDPIVVRKQNQPQRIHEIYQSKLTPPQSDEDEDQYEYQSNDEDEDDNEDEDEETLRLAIELSKQSKNDGSDEKLSSNFPSVAPTPVLSDSVLHPFGELQDEPPAGESTSVKISFRLPFTPESSTSTTIRRFDSSSSVEQLYCYVHSILPINQKFQQFDLFIPFPRESLKSKLSMTIAEAGLGGSQVIMKWE